MIFARIAEKFTAAAIAALSAVLLLLLLKRLTTAAWAWCLTLVYALATETWSISSQALWQAGPRVNWPSSAVSIAWSAGPKTGRETTGCGCAAHAWPLRSSFVPRTLLCCRLFWSGLLLAKASLSQHLRLLAVPFIGGVLLVSYNLYVFQRPSGGYAVTVLNGSMLSGLIGLYLSPGRGLLIYTPVAALRAVRVLACSCRGTPPAQSAAGDGGGLHHTRIAGYFQLHHLVGWLHLGAALAHRARPAAGGVDGARGIC